MGSPSTRMNTTAVVAGGALLVAASHAIYFYICKKEQEKKEKKTVTVTLPDWVVVDYENDYLHRTYTTDESMMKVAVELSAKNVALGTGGPFAAAIFERRRATEEETGDARKPTPLIQLVAVGVNRVVPNSNSTLHGETVAIMFAQQALQTFSLSKELTRGKNYELFTSCEPCVMCLGAILWSGVNRLVCGATKDDAESIGFDEGPVYPQSYQHLREVAKMDVKKQVLREEAAAVLFNYSKQGRPHYAPRGSDDSTTATPISAESSSATGAATSPEQKQQ